jgi:hypothetical protein
MTNYRPGEGYEKGFQCRMNGGAKPSQAVMSTDPYWQEYATGWIDADERIIKEARQKHSNLNENIIDKSFLQD